MRSRTVPRRLPVSTLCRGVQRWASDAGEAKTGASAGGGVGKKGLPATRFRLSGSRDRTCGEFGEITEPRTLEMPRPAQGRVKNIQLSWGTPDSSGAAGNYETACDGRKKLFPNSGPFRKSPFLATGMLVPRA